MEALSRLRWYQPIVQSKYPHFPVFHKILWDYFLSSKPPDILRIAYDVCVGSGREVPPVTNTDLINDWKYLTSYKIDALAELADGYRIYEIKPQANPESVGQLLIYKSLLSPMLQPGTSIEMVIVCDSAHPDMIRACSNHGIEIFVCDILFQIS